MEVGELKEALKDFNQAGTITVAIPSTGQPHAFRLIRIVGHLDHPGEVKTDHSIHVLDVVCDPWEGPSGDEPGIGTIADLAAALAPYPDPMHVRVAVPMSHATISHRMLDIVMVGRVTGAGAGIQIICEHWNNPMHIIKARPQPAEGAQL